MKAKHIIMTLLTLLIISVVLFKLLQTTAHPHRPARSIAKMERIAHGLNEYKAVSNRYPADLEVLLTFEPAKVFLQEDPFVDVWGNHFRYQAHPSGQTYLLRSSGPDKVADTIDDLRRENWDD